MIIYTENEFRSIYDSLYPSTLAYLEALYDNNQDGIVNAMVSIRDVQGLSDDGILDLGKTLKLSKLTDNGRVFVEWFREAVLTHE